MASAATARTPLLAGNPPLIEGVQHDHQSGDEVVDNDISAHSPIKTAMSRRLYISHFFSTWNSRLFEFGATLFLATIFPGTLLPTSVYALARSLSAILFSPAVGRYIDKNNRLVVVRLSVVLQRFSVVGSCAIFWYMLSSEASWMKASLLAVSTFLACVEKLCSIMNKISVERDWVIVIAGSDTSNLKVLNSQMRRIDLFCKLVGPFAISVLDGVSTKIAIIATLGLNVSSVIIEYFAIAKVYSEIPALAEPRTLPSVNQRTTSNMVSRLSSFLTRLSLYFNHPVFRPSMALAFLYFTVLSFGGQMITFLLSAGFTATHIALARIISVSFEISATWLAPLTMSKIGPVRAGLWFINCQALWVTIAGLLFIKIESPFYSAMGLVGGVIVSRVGLWGYDLCAQVIIQEEVEAEHRGSFSSIETSFQSMFELCSYVATIVFFKPEQFRYPVLISPLAVYLAGALFASFVRSRRGHLLHVPLCMKVGETWLQEDHGWERLPGPGIER